MGEKKEREGRDAKTTVERLVYCLPVFRDGCDGPVHIGGVEMVEELFNELVLCLIDFFTGVVRWVSWLADKIEQFNESENGAWFGFLICIAALFFTFLAFLKWLNGV